MNGYERALRALRFEATDCVPTFGGWIVSADFFEYMTGKNFWDDPRGVAMESYRKMQVDTVLQGIYLPSSSEEWRRHTTETLDGADKFKSADNVVAYIETLPDPETLEKEFDFEGQLRVILGEYQELQNDLGSDILCLPSGSDTKFTWYMNFGYESYLSAMALYPDIIKRLFDYSAEEGRLLNTVRVELIRQGQLPPVFFAGQDICGHQGPMVSPDVLRSIFFPAVKHSLAPLVDIGADIIWHSDGYIVPIVDDLIGCGLSGFQGFQERPGYNIGEIASRRVRGSRKPILLAGLRVDTVLPDGSVEDVKREVDRIVRDGGEGGGIFIGTANTAGPDCPNENLETVYSYTHTLPGIKP